MTTHSPPPLNHAPAIFDELKTLLSELSRSARCIPLRLLVTTFNNSNNLLELLFHAYEMNPDPNPYPNPNPNNPNNLLDTIMLLGYNVRIEWWTLYMEG